jgi:outer membrane PBP1 activator LpoA protein
MKKHPLNRLLITLVGLIVLTACHTQMSVQNTLTPEGHKASADRYLKMAAEGNEASRLEYHLHAADHLIKAQQLSKAAGVLRDIQNTERNLDSATRHILLEARLSLLKQDTHRAQLLVSTLLKPYLNSPNLSISELSLGNRKIALLLPSQGPHANAAKIIRDGFLAGYYKTLQHQSSDPTVQVYDTSEGAGVTGAYQKALAEKADFIVGPLTKSEVQTIAGIKLDIPVLALNDIGKERLNTDNLYQFGLMPEDEIAATVINARQQGHIKALIISPQGEWGQRMAQTFKAVWIAHGGEIVSTVILNQKQALDTRIRDVLQDQGGTPRKDIDMVFLAASPELARQVKPLLNHYVAKTLPVYATSTIYSGKPTPSYDHDLDGIHFCDMPWILNHSSELQEARKSMVDAWPSSATGSPRYFALGLDAYYLATQLVGARALPLSGVTRMTGILYMDGHRIQRKLVCAKFEQGVPIPD